MIFEDVKNLYYDIARQLTERYVAFRRLYELDDVVGEVYSRTYPFIPKDSEDIKKLTFYIYQETKNVVYSFYRKQYRGIGSLKHCTKIEFNAIGNKDFQHEYNLYEKIDNWDYLETKIARLSFDERILLYLRHALELTEAAIGKLFGVEFQGTKYDVAPGVINYRLKCIYDKLRVA